MDKKLEKKWVERVKRVLWTTRDDPYLREEEVEKLRQEYRMSRFGEGSATGKVGP